MAERGVRMYNNSHLFFSFSSSPVTLSIQPCDDSLVPYTIDARPGYGTSTHAPTMRSRCSSDLLSLNVWQLSTRAPSHLSTEASPRTSPTGPTLYGRAWFFRRLRGKITCKCLVTVPASFLPRMFSLWSSENPFHFGKWLIPATHPTMQSYIGPGSQTTLPRSRPWRNRFRYFALLEILTYSNDHSFQ